MSLLLTLFLTALTFATVARAVVAFRHRAERGFVWQFWHMQDADWYRNVDPAEDA